MYRACDYLDRFQNDYFFFPCGACMRLFLQCSLWVLLESSVEGSCKTEPLVFLTLKLCLLHPSLPKFLLGIYIPTSTGPSDWFSFLSAPIVLWFLPWFLPFVLVFSFEITDSSSLTDCFQFFLFFSCLLFLLFLFFNCEGKYLFEILSVVCFYLLRKLHSVFHNSHIDA